MNKVVFCNHFGRGFGDDPKYIALALLRHRTNAKLYWMTSDLSIVLPKGIIPIRYGSDIARYHLHTAKVWIFNYKNSFKVPKRKGQYYIQTWHGTFGLKKVEQQVESFLSNEYVEDSKYDSSMIDLMYSNNDVKINLYKNHFWYHGEVIKSDLPQLSVVLSPSSQLKSTILRHYDIPQSYGIVMYAPTFRNIFDPEIYRFNYSIVVRQLEKKFSRKFKLFLRFHPNVDPVIKFTQGSEDIIDVSSYPDMSELLSICDILISDFSSVLLDMALKRSPAFVFAKDYDDYVRNERSLIMPYHETPFDIAKTEEELLSNIDNFDQSLYQKKVTSFFDKIGLEEHGQGDEMISRIVEKHL